MKPKTKPSRSKRTGRVLLLTLILLSAGLVALLRFSYEPDVDGREVKLSEIHRFVASGQVRTATLLDQDARVVVTYCPVTPPDLPAAPDELAKCPKAPVTAHAAYPASDVSTQLLIDSMTKANAAVEVDTQSRKAVAKLVATVVMPLLILANLFGLIFSFKGGDSSISEIAGFGRIGAGRRKKKATGTGVTFADVAGTSEAVAELTEVIDYLRDPKRFELYGATPPKGVLLFGHPGCGKTLLARAVAGESQVPFFPISGAEFVESLVGVGAARVRDLFAQVRAVAPAIVFIDEIDAVGRRRSGEGNSGGEREQTVNQLLVEMDGFEVSSGIVLIAATNRPDILDPALLRPGRFDRHITVEPPDLSGRQAIMELHARGRPVGPDVDFAALARQTSGFTGADLANVVNEAALMALRAGTATIDSSHMAEAVLRVVHGPQRRGRILSAEERTRLAHHEAGHAVVAAALGHRNDVVRVSIVARGRGLGQTVVADEDAEVRSVSDLEASLTMELAGVAAEELVFEQASTGSAKDLSRATAIAKEMVGTYGMSPQVGRRRLFMGEEGYLGDGASLDAVSGALLQVFDDEVKRLLDAGEAKAKMLLTGHRQHLDALAAALEVHETLEGPDLDAHLSEVGPLSFAAAAPGSKARANTRKTAR